jgi:hypothetical protein
MCPLLPSLGLLLLFTAALEAQTAWTKHTYSTDGFEVEFSGPVKLDPTAVDAETRRLIVRATNYLQEGGGYAFIVGASLQRVPVNFENGVGDSWRYMNCAAKVSDTPLPFKGGRAREIRGTNCRPPEGGQYRADTRYFTVGRWFYQVLALHPIDGSREADARRFVESFRVTGQGGR